MSDLLSLGGPLAWLLLGAFVFNFVILFERITYFHRASLNVAELMNGVANLVRRKNYAEAQHECHVTQVPAGRVMYAALQQRNASREDLSRIVEQAARMELPRFESYLAILHSIAHTAPLVGLLGTIVGLLDSFTAFSSASTAATAQQVAQGIYTSLATSAFGLAVAIPALVFYQFLHTRLTHILREMERAGTEIVHHIVEARANTQIADFDSISAGQIASKGEKKDTPAATAENIVEATTELRTTRQRGKRSSAGSSDAS
jgi:biopolymer transport protein ExbB